MDRALEPTYPTPSSSEVDEIVALDDVQLALTAGGVGEVIFPN